jgi:hypothetical protein
MPLPHPYPDLEYDVTPPAARTLAVAPTFDR